MSVSTLADEDLEDSEDLDEFATSDRAIREGWSGEGRLGFSLSSGNSDTQHIELGLEMQYRKDVQEHAVEVGILRARSDDEVLADLREVNYAYDYHWGVANYAFSKLAWAEDRPGDISVRQSGVFGLGRKLHRTSTSQWRGELGLGSKNTEFVSARDGVTQPIAYAGLKGTFKVTDTLSLKLRLSSDTGEKNTETRLQLAAKNTLSENLSLRMQLDARHNSDFTGRLGKHEDVVLGLSLVRSF